MKEKVNEEKYKPNRLRALMEGSLTRIRHRERERMRWKLSMDLCRVFSARRKKELFKVGRDRMPRLALWDPYLPGTHPDGACVASSVCMASSRH